MRCNRCGVAAMQRVNRRTWAAARRHTKRREDRLTVWFMLTGFIAYLAVQVLWYCYGSGVI